MSDPRRLRGGAATTGAKKTIPAARGLSTVSRIRAALSLGRIVLINVLALLVTAAVTAHVVTRPKRPGPGEPERAGSTATPPVAPAEPTGTRDAAPIEVDLD